MESKSYQSVEQFLSPKQIPGASGGAISLPQVRKLIVERQIPFYKIGHNVKIARSDLDIFIANRRVETESSNPALQLLGIARASGEAIDEQSFVEAAALCDQEVEVS